MMRSSLQHLNWYLWILKKKGNFAFDIFETLLVLCESWHGFTPITSFKFCWFAKEILKLKTR